MMQLCRRGRRKAVVGTYLTIGYVFNQEPSESEPRIFKRLRRPVIDSKESIPLANVAWWAGKSKIG